jgi:nitrogen-specific signal transduction histidine kinase
MMVGLHIYRLAKDGALILAESNAAADTILRVHHRSLLGKHLEEAFPAFCATDLPARCRQVAATGGEFSVGNVSYAHADGQAILHLSVFPLASNRVSIAFHDVAAHQQAEAERTHLLAQLDQALAGTVRLRPEWLRGY